LRNTAVRDEDVLWVSENVIQRRIFGSKMEDVGTIGGRRKSQH
jgi:hypothetical protein